jgi:S1-C subfamily serine protease
VLISLSTPTSSLVLSSRGSYSADLFERLPPLPPWIRDLRRVIAESPLPPVVGQAIGADELEPAAEELPFRGAIEERVRANSVMVWANQCGVEVRGSGFVLPGGLVVTNAHVVAGAGDVAVTVDDRDRSAEVVAFAANSDLAVLRVPGIEASGLELGPEVGPDTPVAVAGHPGGQVELDVSPARVDRRIFYDGQNFANQRVFVQAYVLTSPSTEHGSSGGPVLDAGGRVVGVIFAGDEDEDLGMAVSVAELRPVLGQDLARSVAHGTCWVR